MPPIEHHCVVRKVKINDPDCTEQQSTVRLFGRPAQYMVHTSFELLEQERLTDVQQYLLTICRSRDLRVPNETQQSAQTQKGSVSLALSILAKTTQPPGDFSLFSWFTSLLVFSRVRGS